MPAYLFLGVHGVHESQAFSSPKNLGFNSFPASYEGSTGAGVFENTGTQPNRLGRRKADADSNNNNGDNADMEARLAKRNRTGNATMTIGEETQDTPRREISSQLKGRIQPQHREAVTKNHSNEPPGSSVNGQPDIGKRSVSQLMHGSGCQSPGTGFDENCYEWLYAPDIPRNIDQVHSSMATDQKSLGIWSITSGNG
jgi:hypothetical protein